MVELLLGLWTQLPQETTGLKQRGSKPLGEFAKCFAAFDGTRWGDAIEIIRWDEFDVYGKGERRCQGFLPLLSFFKPIVPDG
jgi:hypothetical protein